MIHTKTLLTGALASFALLTLVVSPSLAESRTQTVKSIEENQTQQEISQRTTPSKQTPQQSEEKGCPCCKKMMNNSQEMKNMHEMMGGQQNQPK